jgi:hypothetical protein
LPNYASAHNYFENTPKPPRSKKYEVNERPLASVSASQYKIIKGENYYDIKLYSTVMARYYAPDADGGQRRLYMGHSSMTSRAFMYDVLNMRQTNCYNDQTIIVPVYHRSFDAEEGMHYSLDAYFTANQQIDVSRSRHTPHFKYLSNDDDKANRARMKANLANYVMLAMMRLPDYIDNVDLDSHLGLPFAGFPYIRDAKHAVDDILMGSPTEESINTFFEIGQKVVDMMASKRGYAQDGFRLNTWRGPKSTYSELRTPVTEKDFIDAMTKRVLTIAGANKQSQRIEIPQFPKVGDYPMSNIHF